LRDIAYLLAFLKFLGLFLIAGKDIVLFLLTTSRELALILSIQPFFTHVRSLADFFLFSYYAPCHSSAFVIFYSRRIPSLICSQRLVSSASIKV